MKTNWTYSEMYIMSAMYPTDGMAVAKLLTEKTPSQIKRYAAKHGLKYTSPTKNETPVAPITRSRWTKKDDEILAKNYPTRDVEEIRQMLSGTHTACAIRMRAHQNGIYKEGRRRPKPWTFEEYVIVNAYYPTEGKAAAARLERRTERDVMQFAARMKLKSNVARGRKGVTPAEMKIFKEFRDKGAKYCAKLTGRSLPTVYKYFKVIDSMEPDNTATTWNAADVQYLTINYNVMPTQEIAKTLNRTEKAIRNKAADMGLKKKTV